MGRQIRVRAIRKEEPDLRLYAIALLALARQLQEDEHRSADEATSPSASRKEASDGQR